MFRKKTPQRTFGGTNLLLPPEKVVRLMKTWAWVFRELALPLIREEAFREIYCADNGRPNVPVKTIVGLLILKEMFDWTDEEALWRLEYDIAIQTALDLTPEEAHTCQKTLHNFRTSMIRNGMAQVLFQEMADQIIEALKINAGKQRMDSTHILSNIAILTRLGLFCETLRLFLRDLRRDFPELFGRVPAALAARYFGPDGEAGPYGDARSSEGRRRLAVCARDLWRVLDLFRGEACVKALPSFGLLERLFGDQCEETQAPVTPKDGDEDGPDGPAPATLKIPKDVKASSLQTPHDPDATYSGHKGKGYEVQVAETFGEEGKPAIITHVAVTPSCQGDSAALLPAVQSLQERGIGPVEMVADTSYGSTSNAVACAAAGVDLVSPVPGPDRKSHSEKGELLGKFEVDPAGECPVRCPGGQEASSQALDAKTGKLECSFDGDVCRGCPFAGHCPAKPGADGDRVLRTTLEEVMLEKRLQREKTTEFKGEYDWRAGIEGTNSELKRAHGLGDLRVRGAPRVTLVVYLKATACNIKRMLKHVLKHGTPGQDRAANGAAASVFRVLTRWGTLQGPWWGSHAARQGVRTSAVNIYCHHAIVCFR